MTLLGTLVKGNGGQDDIAEKTIYLVTCLFNSLDP